MLANRVIMGSSLLDIEVAFEGGASTINSNTVTATSITSTYATTIAVVTWEGGASVDPSCTYNGSSMSAIYGTGSAVKGVKFFVIDTESSGNVVASFGSVVGASVSVYSISNLDSTTAVDTDSSSSASASSRSLSALSSPGAGGIRFIGAATGAGSASWTPTNYTEGYDSGVAGSSHTSGYDLGADASTLTATASASGTIIAAGISLR